MTVVTADRDRLVAWRRPLSQGGILCLRAPCPYGVDQAMLEPNEARWEPSVGEYVLDWDDVCQSGDAHHAALAFARAAVCQACFTCGWGPATALQP
jgi:hypothetical protein